MQKNIVIIGLFLSTSSLFCAAGGKSEPTNPKAPALSQLATVASGSIALHSRSAKHARPKHPHSHMSKRQRATKIRKDQASQIESLLKTIDYRDHYTQELRSQAEHQHTIILAQNAEITRLREESGKLQATIFLMQMQIQQLSYPQSSASTQNIPQ